MRRAWPWLAAGLTVLGVLATAAAVGWLAGQQAASSQLSAAQGAQYTADAVAQAAVSEADRADAAAADAEARLRAGSLGICWLVGGDDAVTELAPAVPVPGGVRCPSGAWRYTPALPQPSPAGSGQVGGAP